MFEFLFKYPLSFFQQGYIELGSSWLLYSILIALALVLTLTLLRYTRVRAKTNTLDRVILSALRTLLIAIIVFSLLQPVLVRSSFIPQRSVLAVVLDDSRSMRISDDQGQTRADVVRSIFDPEKNQAHTDLVDYFNENFDLSYFRFASDSSEIDSPALLNFTGGKTDLGNALEHVHKTLAGSPLAGIVLLTDGADNTVTSLNSSLLALKASNIPIYPIGLGDDTFTQDIEISRIQLPAEVLKGSAIIATVSIRHNGYADASVPIIVEDEGRIINSYEIKLTAGAGLQTEQLRLTLDEAGPRQLRFYIPTQQTPQPEAISQNNDQVMIVNVADRKERILYFEGYPRFELKFLRRAVKDDDNLQIVSLLRTAENKFYRLGINDPEELKDGFPTTREELFGYRGLILGNIEASFFSREQLQLIADFVSERGAGLLLLGGRQAFAEGGYSDTPLAAAVPVVLADKADSSFAEDIQIMPTLAGGLHPVTQLDISTTVSLQRWRNLPPLTTVNPIYSVKPGATTLLQSDSAKPLIALATQRYGRGKVIAFSVQNSWLWQMHHTISLDDQTHETIWRQLLRWLVNTTPQQLQLNIPSNTVTPGESVEFNAELRDPQFLPVANAELSALITSPTGNEETLTLTPDANRKGYFLASFRPEQQGLYEIRLSSKTNDAADNSATLMQTESYFTVSNTAHEYYRAEMRSSLLQHIANETGGKFFTPSSLPSLSDDLKPLSSGTSVTERLPLWDMPALFILIIVLLVVEWGYRRLRGLV